MLHLADNRRGSARDTCEVIRVLRTILRGTVVISALAPMWITGCASNLQPSLIAQAQTKSVGSAHVSWMDPAAKTTPTLLYVSNYSAGDVTVYSYQDAKNIKLLGTITGFLHPEGLCSDNSGNVWVSDYGGKALYEYAHGGSMPIAKIHQHAGYPNDCAVDPKTGNLAVANALPTFHYRDEGVVTVYKPGAHEGTHYRGGSLQTRYFDLTYDNKSNLFVECEDDYGYIGPLAEAPAGSTSFNQIELGSSVEFSAFSGLQWINPTLLMGGLTDSEYSSVAYKLLVSGSSATVVQTLRFSNTQQAQGMWRRAGNVAVTDYLNDAVEIYRISDGSYVTSVTDDISGPYGTTISALPKK
jgi:hypothetical protein